MTASPSKSSDTIDAAVGPISGSSPTARALSEYALVCIAVATLSQGYGGSCRPGRPAGRTRSRGGTRRAGPTVPRAPHAPRRSARRRSRPSPGRPRGVGSRVAVFCGEAHGAAEVRQDDLRALLLRGSRGGERDRLRGEDPRDEQLLALQQHGPPRRGRRSTPVVRSPGSSVWVDLDRPVVPPALVPVQVNVAPARASTSSGQVDARSRAPRRRWSSAGSAPRRCSASSVGCRRRPARASARSRRAVSGGAGPGGDGGPQHAGTVAIRPWTSASTARSRSSRPRREGLGFAYGGRARGRGMPGRDLRARRRTPGRGRRASSRRDPRAPRRRGRPARPGGLVEATVERFGGLDIVVANAGGPPRARALEVDRRRADRRRAGEPAGVDQARRGGSSRISDAAGGGRIVLITSHGVQAADPRPRRTRTPPGRACGRGRRPRPQDLDRRWHHAEPCVPGAPPTDRARRARA